MQQDDLFFERIEDALGAVVERCGGRKRFACELFPEKPSRDAHNLLDAMLNPERRERCTPAQVVYIARRGREAGCHAVMQFLAREAGYEVPQPLEPAEQEAGLQREFIAAVAQLEAIQRQLQRAQQLRRVG